MLLPSGSDKAKERVSAFFQNPPSDPANPLILHDFQGFVKAILKISIKAHWPRQMSNAKSGSRRQAKRNRGVHCHDFTSFGI